MDKSNLKQSEAFAIELRRLNEDVTATDREVAKMQFDLSRSTISLYLNGHVRDNDTAAQLIAFFKNRISRRNLVLLDNIITNKVLMHG